MKRSVRNQLNQINLTFYREHADEFSDTRRHPWESFSLLDELLSELPSPLSVLDVGCGNGRLGVYLKKQTKLAYTGVDVSEEMLVKAKHSVGKEHSYVRADIVEQPLTELSLADDYDTVALMAVMHHIPGIDRRKARLLEAAQLVAPGGVLLVTFWQFAKFDRFWQKIRSWSTVGLSDADLEEGDYLLTFGEDSSWRYCHHFSDAEVDILVESLPLNVVTDTQADGKINRYNRTVLMRKPATNERVS